MPDRPQVTRVGRDLLLLKTDWSWRWLTWFESIQYKLHLITAEQLNRR